MSHVVFHDIPRSVLATLLDQLGPPGRLSPRLLMGGAVTLARQHLAELHGGGFVELPEKGAFRPTPEFDQAARVILAPATTVNLRAWRDESACAETSLLFPGSILEGDGVVLNQIDGNYRICVPAGCDDLVDLLGGIVPLAGDLACPFDFDAHLDGPVAATLCGLIDLVRQNGANDKGVDPVQLAAWLAGQWGLTGFDRLLSYVTVTGAMPTPPAHNAVAFSLGMLERAGLVENPGGGCTLAPAIRPVLPLLPSVLPGFQWQRVSDIGGDSVVISHRIFILGNDGWVLRFAPSSRGRVFINSRTAAQVLDELVDELATIVPRGPESLTSHRVSTNPGAGSSRDSVRRCPVCGKPQDRPMRFCTACGASVPAEVESPRCRACSAPLIPGKRFCTHCGTPR